MIDKTLATCGQAVADAFDGAAVMVGGFGETSMPGRLVEALRQQGATGLTIISNGCGGGDHALGGLMLDGRVRKLYCSFPNYPAGWAFRDRYLKGEVELELMPQGTLVERIRAAGAGLGGIYTPTGAGTQLTLGKEHRVIGGRQYVLELPLHADFVLVKAHRADRLGNLCYRGSMRSFNHVMATAGKVVIAEVDEIVPVGTLSPEEIHTPGIFIHRVVEVDRLPQLFVVRREESAS